MLYADAANLVGVMSLATPSSSDVGLSSSTQGAYANESEDDDPVSNYSRDEAIFAEDPFSQNDSEPYALLMTVRDFL